MKKIFLLFVLFFYLFAPCFAHDLDEKIAQMIIIGFDGNSINSRGFKKVLKQVEQGEISGVIIFSKNIKSKEDLIKMNEKLLSSSKITPFISIDNEGGQIQRHDFIESKSAKEVSFLSPTEAKEEYSKMAELLEELKINYNFAPCVDLEINKNSIISKKQRSYGTNYEEVSKYAGIFIEEHNKRKIITSIKHFPGHGSIEADTHKGFADSSESFLYDEIMPYYLLSNSDSLNTVMISHIFNSNFDKNFPASLSKDTIDFLRNKISFKGVIVSDDYDMGAIRKNYSLEDIVVNSINSGINILLFSNNIKRKDKNLALKIRKIVHKQIKSGNISIDKIDESYKKILKLKSNLK